MNNKTQKIEACRLDPDGGYTIIQGLHASSYVEALATVLGELQTLKRLATNYKKAHEADAFKNRLSGGVRESIIARVKLFKELE